MLRWLLALTAVVFVINNLDSLGKLLPDVPGSDTSTQTTPCPAAAAKWLPDGGSGAVLEAAFVSPRHVITLCRTGSGELYYDGQFTGQPVDSTTHISIPAVSTEAGYTATNGGYKYEVNGSEVIVTLDGNPMARLPLTRTGP